MVKERKIITPKSKRKVEAEPAPMVIPFCRWCHPDPSTLPSLPPGQQYKGGICEFHIQEEESKLADYLKNGPLILRSSSAM